MVKPAIGFIGLGKMGLPMSRHLLEGGYRVEGCDPMPSRIDALEALGGHIAASPRAAAANNGVVFASIPHDAALRSIVFGADGLLAGAHPNLTFIETSTVSPAVSAEVAAACSGAGIRYLRAPVSGNAVIAEAAGLTVMASGPRTAYDAALPLFQRIGKTFFYLGDGEQARTMKLAINLMIAVSTGMMAEALALGAKGGLDWDDMLDVMEASAVGSPMVKYKAATLRKRDYASTFSCEQMAKDLHLILQAAEQTHVPAALAAQSMQSYQAAIAQGEGDLDFSAVVRVVRRLSGLPEQ